MLTSPSFRQPPAPGSQPHHASALALEKPQHPSVPATPIHGPFYLPEAAYLALLECAEPPSLGVPGQRVSCTPEPRAASAGRSTGHFCSHSIAACVHEGQAGLCSYHGREQAASCRKGPHHGAAGLGHMLPFTSTGRARLSKSLAASTLGCINNQLADGEGFTSCFS